MNGWYFHVFVTNNPKSLSTNKVYFLSEIKFSVNFSIDPLKQFSVLCRSTARETMAANRCMKHRNNRSNCSKSSYFVTYIFYKNHYYDPKNAFQNTNFDILDLLPRGAQVLDFCKQQKIKLHN